MKQKKALSILLIITLTVPMFLFVFPLEAKAFTYGSKYKNPEFAKAATWEEDKVKYNIPENTNRENIKGLPLNLTLWRERSLIVYGNYTSFPAGFNRFKKDAVESSLNPNGPYYKENGSGDLGEYEYHGWTYDNIAFTNMYFPDDAQSGRSPEDNKWVFQPWDIAKLKEQKSIWNDNAPTNSIIYNWIDKGIGFNIVNSTNSSNKEKYNYLNILQAPSARFPGEGKMWNQSLYNESKYYYQNFSVNKTEDKLDTPIETSVDVLNKTLVLERDEDTFNLKIDVYGTLKDETYYNDPIDKSVYYTREEITTWEFTINGVTKKYPGNKDIVKPKENQAKAYYKIPIPRTTLEQNPDFQIAGTVKITYSNGHTATAPVNKTVTIPANADLLSYFSINENIELLDGGSLSSGDINYLDGSYGEITRYDISIENGATGDAKSFTGPISNSSVNSFLHGFIYPKVKDMQIEGESKSFTVTQSIVNAEGKSDTYSRKITVSIGTEEFVYVQPNVDIPNKAFDIIAYKPKDYTDSSTYSSRRVFIDGKEVNANYFFSGNYTFGIGNHGIKNVKIKYVSTTGEEAIQSEWVKVYDTKPRVQFDVEGSYKENRKMTITNTSESANDPYVLSYYPITNYTWSFSTVEGDSENFKLNDINELYKEFLSKEPGTYHVRLNGVNTLGRSSDPYDLDINIIKDYEPAIEANIWNNVLARNEKLNMYISTSSTDNDLIAASVMEIFYDANNDGEADTLLATYNTEEFSEFIPTELGNYKIIITATEEFGEETLPEYVTEDDRKQATLERDFFVDNFRPVTDLYVDIPIDTPDIDLYIMTDKNLERNKNDWILANKMNISNDLLLENIIPNTQTWDMYTYVYSKDVTTTQNTGQEDPPSTFQYSSEGYSGTLDIYDTVDNGEYVDQGKYVYKTYYKTFSRTHDNTVKTKGTLVPYKETYRSESSPAPSSKYINSDGYKGYIPRTSTSRISRTYTSNPDTNSWSDTSKWRAYYSGKLSKRVKVWQSDWVWVSDYTGYYSGTIYKDVRQSFTDPFNTTSDKYIIYVSEDIVNESNDLDTVLNKADSKLILIGTSSIKAQYTTYDYFIGNNGQPIEDLIYQAVDYIKNEERIESAQYKVLLNESFNISYGDLDLDNDPVTEEKFQIVHNPNYYDNSMGQGKNTVASYSDNNFTLDTAPASFSKAGEYTIYRRIKDIPSTDPNFSDYAMYSGARALKIYVHRKPIANATLDWDFDPVEGVYKTGWIDNSYDPDHQYSDPDKGISEQNIKYSRNGGPWYYKIPDNLEPGDYVVEYRVKDLEGVWSDPWLMNFSLDTAPDMQLIDAKLTTANPKFSTSSIPVTEKLKLYDVVTRYPFDTHLEIAIYKGGIRKSWIKTVNFTEGVTGTKTNNDIYWHDIIYTIPATLADGNYTLKVKAVGSGNKQAEKNLPFTINTPTNLQIFLPSEMDNLGHSFELKAETSKYVSEVQVIIYQGTEYETPLNLNIETTTGDKIIWKEMITPDSNIPEGDYTAEYIAQTVNGNRESKTANFQLITLKVTGFVQHVDLWNDHRMQYNRSKTGMNDTPRTYDVFFPGEKFILKAETAGDVKKVTAEILDKPYKTTLTNTSDNIWEGELWHKDMMWWKTQDLTFRFTAESENGLIKKYYVPIKIDDDPYWRGHTIK